MLPNKKWINEHLIITGGEPLLGWQRSYEDLLSNDHMSNLKSLTFETNGTQELTDDFKMYLYNFGSKNRGNTEVVFSVSAKLSPSGESWVNAIKPKIVAEYEAYGDVYLMPVGGTADLYFSNYQAVAEMAMKKGWRYSPRLQVDIWRNAWGT
jgi:organic radical activating enzyme